MTYEEARTEFARAEQIRGIRPGLTRMRRLTELLGNPEKAFCAPVSYAAGGEEKPETPKAAVGRRKPGMIHVAGTNGKGSVLAFLDEILRQAGYHVVKYTSPAVFMYTERYMSDGRPISEERFARLAERVLAAARCMDEESGDPPTVFEMETAIAYLFAAEEGCDFFLVETGMGGRGDATNIENRVLMSIITSVSMDHMAYLGNTVEAIAREKAGIIKDGCPVVVSCGNRGNRPENSRENMVTYSRENMATYSRENMVTYSQGNKAWDSPDLSGIFEEEAAKHHAPLFWGECDVPYETGLAGSCQRENAGTALTAVRLLNKSGYDIPESGIREGFARTVWPGRFEMVRQNPVCILDGAHNAGAARELARTLQTTRTLPEKIYLVFGIFKDKEYEKVLRQIVPFTQVVYAFGLESPRGLDVQTLAECARTCTDKPVFACKSLEEALTKATLRARQQDGMVLCCGSLSWLAAAKRILAEL